jgi:hypothetical protein
VRLFLVPPAVPRADGEGVVDAHVELAVFLFLGRFLVRLVVGRAGKNSAGEEEARAVGRELRRADAGREVRHALGLAAAPEVEDVDLRLFISISLCGEGDAFAVR